MFRKLDQQTCKSEFELHWVSHSFRHVPHLIKMSMLIPWRTYLRTSTLMMFCRSWKRPGCTRKYRLGYNPENTTNQSTESKLLLNRNTIMFVFVEIVIIIIIIIIIIIVHSLELFTSAIADGFSLESEWQQVSSSLLKSPGLFLVFWQFSTMLSFGWSPLVRQPPSPLVPLVIP